MPFEQRNPAFEQRKMAFEWRNSALCEGSIAAVIKQFCHELPSRLHGGSITCCTVCCCERYILHVSFTSFICGFQMPFEERKVAFERRNPAFERRNPALYYIKVSKGLEGDFKAIRRLLPKYKKKICKHLPDLWHLWHNKMRERCVRTRCFTASLTHTTVCRTVKA